MPRYTIVEHQWNGIHWDLFLENGDSLITWEFNQLPEENQPIKISKKPNHRLIYLDYEGKISGDRGGVTQWDTGYFEWKKNSPYKKCFSIKGSKLIGNVNIEKCNGEWVFCIDSIF